MPPVSNAHVLDALLNHFRLAADALPDRRTGSNKRYGIADAAACALATFFFQAPSFLDFQRRMQEQSARSNCHSLFGVGKIPGDNRIRELLDGLDPARLADLFPSASTPSATTAASTPSCASTAACSSPSTASSSIAATPSIAPSARPATSASTRPSSTSTPCSRPPSSPTGHNRVLPLMPLFVQPQHDPAASRADLTEEQRKQDCERNAAKRWLPAHIPALLPCRPVILGDDLYCCQPLCTQIADLGADFLFICKPSPHKTVYKQLPNRRIWSTGRIRTRNRHRQVEHHRFQWRNNVPLRAGKNALKGNWIDFEIWRRGERTDHNSFFTSLTVTADNVAQIARAARARWKIENEAFNCLSRQGYNCKHNFGHGKDGLANLLATLNLFAFALHTVLDCVADLWRRCRDKSGTRRRFFATLSFLTEWFCFPSWTVLLETLLRERAPPPGRGPAASSPA